MRVQTWLAPHRKTICVGWLPAYAPELNPAEHVWNHTTYSDLANFAPAALDHLEGAVSKSLLR
jgi:transposase